MSPIILPDDTYLEAFSPETRKCANCHREYACSAFAPPHEDECPACTDNVDVDSEVQS